MTKQEMYDNLKTSGVKLKAINFCKPEYLEELYKQQFPDNQDQNHQNNNQDCNQENKKPVKIEILTIRSNSREREVSYLRNGVVAVRVFSADISTDKINAALSQE